MSSYIPLEIQLKMIEKLPIKSLIRFRSVCKTWKSTIDCSQFVADYTIGNTAQPHNLLVSYGNYEKEVKFVSFVDDDTFPKQTFTPIVPPLLNLLTDWRIIGSSYGLICFQGGYFETERVIVWNPSIVKSIVISLPNEKNWSTTVGFGVVPDTLDPMLVHISYNNVDETRVKVFKLSSGEWSNNNVPPRETISFVVGCAIGQYIYWICVDTSFLLKALVVSFDMNTQEFIEIDLPDDLAEINNPVFNLPIYNLRESLVVVDCKSRFNDIYDVCDVWIMDDDSKSFKKLYNIKVPDGFIIYGILGFRKSGEPIVEMEAYFKDHYLPATLFVHQLCSKNFQDLEVFVGAHSFNVNSYTESLLLLDQKDNSIFSV